MGQFHIDLLTSAVPGARLTTRNKAPVNMEKYVKLTRSHRVDREKQKHNFRYEPYRAKGADATQRRQDWKEKPREEKYDFRMCRKNDHRRVDRVPSVQAPLKTASNVKQFGPTTSTDVARKHLLRTLKNDKNPVAHSTAPMRAGNCWLAVDACCHR